MNIKVETLATIDAGTGGLSIDHQGSLYCGDFGAILGDHKTMGRQIFRIASSGAVERFADGLEGASGNTIGPDGALYQSNIRGNWVARIGQSGAVSRYAEEGIHGPVGIGFDSKGRLHVANCGNNTIARVEQGKACIIAEDPRFKCPNGLAFDRDDNLYMANFYDGNVFKVTPKGSIDLLASMPGSNNGHLCMFRDHLIVVARGAHQLISVSLQGEVKLFAGTGRCGDNDGGPDECEFSFPNAITVDAKHDCLYINESAARAADGLALCPTRIRKILV